MFGLLKKKKRKLNGSNKRPLIPLISKKKCNFHICLSPCTCGREKPTKKILHPVLPQGKAAIKQRLCFKAMCLVAIGASLLLLSSPALPMPLSSSGTMPEQGLLAQVKCGGCNEWEQRIKRHNMRKDELC